MAVVLPPPAKARSLKVKTAQPQRPAILIKNGTFDIEDGSTWSRLSAHRPVLERAIAATGRIDTEDAMFSFVGTAFLIDPRRAVTANYVAEALAQRRGEDGKLRGVWLNLKAEAEEAADGKSRIAIDDFRLVHPYWGFAFLELRESVDAALAAPLAVARKQSLGDLKDRDICVIGYPARDSREDDDHLERIFGEIYDCKRLMPGRISGAGRWGSEDSPAILHDATTTGGASGAPLIDIETGLVIGIHVAGKQLVTNYAAPAWEIGRDPQWTKDRTPEPDSVSIARTAIGASLNERSIFSFDEVINLHQDLLDAGVTDDTQIAILFQGFPNEFVAALPSQGAPSQRLLLMLHAVNKAGGKIGGHSAFYYILRSSEAVRSWDEEWKQKVQRLLADVIQREAKPKPD